MKLFVIIVTFKGKLWYDRCFTSLRETTIPVQTIVVDNASNDGSVEYIREHFPEFHLIESKENLGFGRANNIGMRYALENGCDYVFLLNQDAWVEPDTFEKMIGIHQRHQEYGVLGCVNLVKEKNHILEGFIPTIFDIHNCSWSLIDDLYFSRLKEVYEVKSIMASAWLLPRHTLEIVGGFDPIFFHLGEDDNYQQRVWYHGMKVGVCPQCPIVHDAQTIRLKEAIELRKKEYAQKREWILDWCDVNNPEMTKNQAPILFGKFIKQCCQFNFTKASYYWQKYKCYCENRSSICHSIVTNQKGGSHYLKDLD